MRKKNLLGQKFNRWTVIDYAPPRRTSGGNSIVMWHCRCDCGNESDVSYSSLRRGDSKSCGCLNQEKIHESKHKITCIYDLTGEYGIGYTSKGDEFWFDKEDYDIIKDYSWFKHHKYFTASVPMTNKKIFLHRLIMGLADSEYDYKIDVDHIVTENKFDNRKSNLRIVTKSQNNINKIIQRNNTSGCSGVTYHTRDNVWEVTINIDGKRKYIGRFNNKQDAIDKRKWAEDYYYGEYSYDNSQHKGGN